MNEDITKLLNEVQGQVMGLRGVEAVAVIKEKGLKCRYIQIDNMPCMITADVNPNRINLTVKRGVVVATELG